MIHRALGIAGLMVVVAGQAAAADAGGKTIYGEPYALRGSRLVFTHWVWVRAGNVGWVDASGKPVYATHDTMTPPDEGRWRPDPNNAWGVRLKAYPPSERRKLAIAPEHPWETGPVGLECIVEDGGVYKAWGSCAGRPCYLESRDGLAWTRPEVGLVEFEGSRANNLIPSAPKRNVFVDPSSEYRYKSIWEAFISQEEFEAFRARHPECWSPLAQRELNNEPMYLSLKAAQSKDGFIWEELDAPLVVDHVDTLDIGHYDVRRGKYVLYVRTWNALPRAECVDAPRWDSWLSHARRCVGYMESDTFGEFRPAELILEPSLEMHPTAGLYTNCFTWIPKAPECLLMFPAVYYLNNDTTDVWLATSWDGKCWNWAPGNEPLFKTGVSGTWDGGCIFANPPLMELGDGSFALPYFATDVPHKYPRGHMKTGMGYAIWPHGRLMAMVAEERGAFATVALIPPGRTLFVNARTLRAGHVRVAVFEGRQGGRAVEGRDMADCAPIMGDHPRTQVRWTGGDDLGVAEGAPVMLRFELEQAELFGIEFE